MDAALRCALGFIFKNVLSSSSSSLVNGAKVLLSSLPITNAPHLEARWKGSQSVSQSAIQADQTAVACPCADVYACGWGFCFALVCLSSQQQQLGQQWWLANRPAGNCQSNPNRIHHRWFPVTSSDPFQNGLIRRRRHSRRRGKKTILFKQNHGKIRPKGLRGMFNIDGQSHPSKLYDLDTHKMMLLNVADWIVIVYHVNRLVLLLQASKHGTKRTPCFVSKANGTGSICARYIGRVRERTMSRITCKTWWSYASRTNKNTLSVSRLPRAVCDIIVN